MLNANANSKHVRNALWDGGVSGSIRTGRSPTHCFSAFNFFLLWVKKEEQK
jgi:hypothetical protein